MKLNRSLMMLHRYTLQLDPGRGTVGENFISERKMRNNFGANHLIVIALSCS